MDDFELRHLRYFVAVAELLSFTRAARRLNIAQPALSHQIRQLETMIGAPLFTRTSRRVELTAAGDAFLTGARSALAEASRSAESARRASKGQTSSLRIGYTDSAALSVLPQSVKQFRKRHPEIHLELTDGSSRAQLNALERNAIDLALIRGPVSNKLLESRTVYSEPFGVVVPETHPFAKRTRVTIDALASEPLVLFPRHLAPEFHDVITSMFTHRGSSPKIEHQATEYHLMVALVEAGLGVSIVPRSVGRIVPPGVVFRPLPPSAGTAEIIVVFKPHRLTQPARQFLEVGLRLR